MDTTVFKAHSTRAAAASAASAKKCAIDDVLKDGGWSSVTTLAKYYGETCTTQHSFADAILDK